MGRQCSCRVHVPARGERGLRGLKQGDQVQRNLRLVTAIAVTGAIAAGCGSSSSSSHTTTANFSASYASIANQLKQVSHSIGVAIQQAPSHTDAQLGALFHQLATKWQSKLSQLETLKPPPGQAANFNTLTNAVTRAESDLTAIVSAAETHSKSAAEQAAASLVTDIETAKSANTSITSKSGGG